MLKSHPVRDDPEEDPMRAAWVAASLAAALTGCAGLPTTINQNLSSGYLPLEARSVMGGEMGTVIYGSPFGAPRDGFEAAVTAAMYGQHFGPPTRFVPIPPSAAPRYRIVMAFNPGTAVFGDGLCRLRQDPPTLPALRPARVEAAFCRDRRALTSTTGLLAGIATADDPRFGVLIGQVTRDLFPPRDPGEDDRIRPLSRLD
jgi:hypothetical protein